MLIVADAYVAFGGGDYLDVIHAETSLEIFAEFLKLLRRHGAREAHQSHVDGVGGRCVDGGKHAGIDGYVAHLGEEHLDFGSHEFAGGAHSESI